MTLGKKILFVFACLFFVLTLVAFIMTTELYVSLRAGGAESSGTVEAAAGALAVALALVISLIFLWSAAFIDILLSAFLCRTPVRFARICAIVFLAADALMVLASIVYLIWQ